MARRPITAQERSEMALFWDQGTAVAELAEMFECKAATVRNALRQQGYPVGTRQSKKDDADEKAAGETEAFRAEFESLGAPPTDPLQRVQWAGQMLALSMRQVGTTRAFDNAPKDRWRTMTQLGATIASLTPRARLMQAEQVVSQDTEKLKAGDTPAYDDTAKLRDAKKQPARRRRASAKRA